MNDFMEMAIPAAVVITIFLIIFGFVAFMRYLRFKETIALAEKGLIREKQNGRNGRDSLKWGIVFIFVGMGLCVGLYPVGFIVDLDTPFYLGPWLLAGLLPMSFGMGLVTVYWATQRGQDKEA